MIKCIAIDDEPLALRQLSKYMERIDDLEVVALCNSAHSAENVLGEKEVDVMFVDINMPDLSGVDFVRGLENPPMVIFTTAYSEYAIEGFKLDAVDYLLKPFSFDEFQRAVGKVRSLIELQRLREEQVTSSVEAAPTQGAAENKDCISIKADYKVSLVKYADIIYIESVGEYVRLHLTTGTSIMTLLRLKNIESALPADRFMRVHRSYIVNLGHVTGYARGRVYLDNEEYVPISVNYRDSFREYVDSMHPAQ
ncbi:MAG: response regulator transcription factor [Alistipes sp.]|nr:response regulator transcription factor [Alistipes sp.]